MNLNLLTLKNDEINDYLRAYESIHLISKDYPEFFFKQGYTIIYFVEELPRKKYEEGEEIKDKFNWNLFMVLCMTTFKDKLVYMEALDFFQNSDTAKFKIRLDFLTSKMDFNIFLKETAFKTFESGVKFFSESKIWSVFYGEEVFNKIQNKYIDQEFDIFAVKPEYETQFIEILKKCYSMNSIIFEQVNNNQNIFKDSIPNNTKVFEILVKNGNQTTT